MNPDFTGAWNMPYMMPPPGIATPGYEAFYNAAMLPESVLPESPEEKEVHKVKTLSKHIKSLRKQVQKLQNTVNQNMRSDSDNTTLSDGDASSTVSCSSSNEDGFVTSKTSSADLDLWNHVVDNKLVGA